MLPLIDVLKQLAADAPTRTRWVVVPTHAAGRMVTDSVALALGGWANIRIVTPLDLAVRMGAPFLVERGIDPSEEGLGPALIMQLALQLPEENAYFRPLAHQPEMALSLWRTLGELRMAGIGTDDLARGTFGSPDKQRELADLLRAYERFLSETTRGDRATVVTEALRHPEWCPVQADDMVVEWPAIWSPLERRLLDALPGEHIPVPVTEPPGIARPRLLRAEGASARPAVAAIDYFRSGGSEAEVEEVFRRVMARRSPIDTVEIACAAHDTAPLVWEKAVRHGWPVTLAMGIRATATRPGRALLGLIGWIEDDFSAGHLRRLLQSGDVHMGDVAIPAGRAARLLVRARTAWGRRTYALALGRLAAGLQRRAGRDDVSKDERDRLRAQAAEATTLATWLDDLIGRVPSGDVRGRVPLQPVVDLAVWFVEHHAARASALDHLAAARLTSAVTELRALGEAHLPLPEALQFIAERVESLSVGADRARPGHLHVTRLADAGLSGRPVVFVIGLEEGRVFPSSFEDPVLLDAERASLSPELKQSADVVDEAVFAATSRLAELAGTPGVTLTLSYSCRELRQFRESYPSWLLLYVNRLQTGNAMLSFAEFEAGLGAPVSCVPVRAASAASVGRWWLHGVTRAAPDRAARAVLSAFPGLAAGRLAAEARAAEALSPYDGFVPAAGPVLDPCRDDVVVSATQLEQIGNCAFRYFLERGLRVRAIETGERDQDLWLDPLARGSLLHEVYATFMRRCRAEGRSVDLETDLVWIRGEGERILDELAVEMPPPSSDIEETERAAFYDDLAVFVREEARRAGQCTAVGFEVGFGREARHELEELSSDDPVTLTIGGLTLRLAGRIDRIDRLADGTFEIVDYKTGRYWTEGGVFAGGRQLQLALYGLAVTELLRRTNREARVSSARYYFSSRKGRARDLRFAAPAPEDLAAVLTDIREVIVDGLFVHTPREDSCKFCDYGPACGAQPFERAGAKQDERLMPWRRLASRV